MKSIKNFMILSLFVGMISTSVSCAVPGLEDNSDSDIEESEQAAVLGASVQFEEQLFGIVEAQISDWTVGFELQGIDRINGTQEKNMRYELLGFVFKLIAENFSLEKIKGLLAGVETICFHEKSVRKIEKIEDDIDLVSVRETLDALKLDALLFRKYQKKVPKYVNSNNVTIKKMLEFVWKFFTRQEMDFFKERLEFLSVHDFNGAPRKLDLAEQKTLSQVSPKFQRMPLVRQESSPCSLVAPVSPSLVAVLSPTLSTLSLDPVQRSTSGPASPATPQLTDEPSPTRLVSVGMLSPAGSTSSLGSTEPLQRSKSSPVLPISPDVFMSPPSADEPSPMGSVVSFPTAQESSSESFSISNKEGES